MNLPEKLAREIRRVTELREQYRKLEGTPNVMVAPAMAMMNLALETACTAAGDDNVINQILALKELEGFEK